MCEGVTTVRVRVHVYEWGVCEIEDVCVSVCVRCMCRE